MATLLLCLASCGSEEPAQKGEAPAEQAGPPPALVRVDLVKRQTVAHKRLVTGRLEPSELSEVAAEEPGKVIVAPPDAGTLVKAGQLLASLDTAILDRQLAVAQSELLSAQAARGEVDARLAQATSQRKRLESLVSDGSVTQSDFDVAVRDEQVASAQLVVTQASIAMRQAELELTQERLRKMKIVAPFDGVITAKHTELGQWLAEGMAAVTLMRIDPIDAVLDVPEYMVEHLSEESELTIEVPALGSSHTGRVHKLVPDADRMTRTFPVEVRLVNSEQSLRPGMSVRAELSTGSSAPSITVHRDAVQTTPTGTIVYAHRGGVAVPVPVHIQFKVEDRFVVDAPLNDGEEVVIEGNERLFPGQPVSVQQDPAEGPDAASAPQGPSQ